jgi:hypothetical protein
LKAEGRRIEAGRRPFSRMPVTAPLRHQPLQHSPWRCLPVRGVPRVAVLAVEAARNEDLAVAQGPRTGPAPAGMGRPALAAAPLRPVPARMGRPALGRCPHGTPRTRPLPAACARTGPLPAAGPRSVVPGSGGSRTARLRGALGASHCASIAFFGDRSHGGLGRPPLPCAAPQPRGSPPSDLGPAALHEQTIRVPLSSPAPQGGQPRRASQRPSASQAGRD